MTILEFETYSVQYGYYSGDEDLNGFQEHGSFSEFSSSQETWKAYVERLEQYLAANKIEDADQQRAILLSVCGPATYRLICSLVSPRKPAELKFKEITETVQKHHDPKPSIIVQRYHFNTRHRRVGELVSTYVPKLCHLSNHWPFPAADATR